MALRGGIRVPGRRRIGRFVFRCDGVGQAEVVSGGARGNRGSPEPDEPGQQPAPSGVGQAVVAGAGAADVTERLLAEFDGELDSAVVAAVVLDCRAELAAVPAGALPELLERLARERLREHPVRGPG
jgi:hypothetical protein